MRVYLLCNLTWRLQFQHSFGSLHICRDCCRRCCCCCCFRCCCWCCLCCCCMHKHASIGRRSSSSSSAAPTCRMRNLTAQCIFPFSFIIFVLFFCAVWHGQYIFGKLLSNWGVAVVVIGDVAASYCNRNSNCKSSICACSTIFLSPFSPSLHAALSHTLCFSLALLYFLINVFSLFIPSVYPSLYAPLNFSLALPLSIFTLPV